MSIFKREIEQDLTDMVTGKKLIRRDYRRPGQSEYFYLSKNADGSHNQIDVPDDFGRRWYGKTLPDNPQQYYQPIQQGILYNDCSNEARFNKFMSRLRQPDREGIGYNDNLKTIDQPTHTGISNNFYNLMRNKYPEIKENYPSLKNLTTEQINNLYCQGIYKPYRIKEIKNDDVADHVFDIFVNHSYKTAVPVIQQGVNSIKPNTVLQDGQWGSKTINALNGFDEKETNQLNNSIATQRIKAAKGTEYEKRTVFRAKTFIK